MTYFTHKTTPAGTLLITGDGTVITGLHWSDGLKKTDWQEKPELFQEVSQQLDEYFAGTRQVFTIPYRWKGTEFQEAVWQALTEIAFGKTTTYGALAQKIGRPKAVRAVGTAVGANPLSIIVPCHRVVATGGGLGGYAGGLACKKVLLEREGCGLAPGEQAQHRS